MEKNCIYTKDFIQRIYYYTKNLYKEYILTWEDAEQTQLPHMTLHYLKVDGLPITY